MYRSYEASLSWLVEEIVVGEAHGDVDMERRADLRLCAGTTRRVTTFPSRGSAFFRLHSCHQQSIVQSI